MTEKRFIDNGFEAIEEQSFTDTETDKTYYVDYFDEIIDLANGLNEKNKVLRKEIERLKRQNEDILYSNAKNMELLEKENEQLKQFFNKCEDEMQYYRSKSASLEEGYLAYQNENEKLKQILREVEHELISITGLSAFDKCASQLGYVEVFDEDRIELDYSKLLKRIEKVIK